MPRAPACIAAEPSHLQASASTAGPIAAWQKLLLALAPAGQLGGRRLSQEDGGLTVYSLDGFDTPPELPMGQQEQQGGGEAAPRGGQQAQQAAHPQGEQYLPPAEQGQEDEMLLDGEDAQQGQGGAAHEAQLHHDGTPQPATSQGGLGCMCWARRAAAVACFFQSAHGIFIAPRAAASIHCLLTPLVHSCPVPQATSQHSSPSFRAAPSCTALRCRLGQAPRCSARRARLTACAARRSRPRLPAAVRTVPPPVLPGRRPAPRPIRCPRMTLLVGGCGPGWLAEVWVLMCIANISLLCHGKIAWLALC